MNGLKLARHSTGHSKLVPMPRDAVTSSISAQTSRAEVLRRARVILWDEAPMAPKAALEAVDRLLRDLMDLPDDPFGGKVLVMGGDFRQVLPVMPHTTREDMISHSIKNHYLWKDGRVEIFSLAENMRATGDSHWRDYLLHVGDGTLPTNNAISSFAIPLPTDMCAPSD